MTAAALVRDPRRPPAELLQLIASLCGYFQKPYVWPSQSTLVHLLATRYRIFISRRTLNRWLRRLEDLGLIDRKRRHCREQRPGRPAGRLILRSTLYFVTSFGRRILRSAVDNLSKFLRGLAVTATAQHFHPVRSLVRKGLQQPAGRWPPPGRNGNDAPPREGT